MPAPEAGSCTFLRRKLPHFLLQESGLPEERVAGARARSDQLVSGHPGVKTPDFPLLCVLVVNCPSRSSVAGFIGGKMGERRRERKRK